MKKYLMLLSVVMLIGCFSLSGCAGDKLSEKSPANAGTGECLNYKKLAKNCKLPAYDDDQAWAKLNPTLSRGAREGRDSADIKRAYQRANSDYLFYQAFLTRAQCRLGGITFKDGGAINYRLPYKKSGNFACIDPAGRLVPEINAEIMYKLLRKAKFIYSPDETDCASLAHIDITDEILTMRIWIMPWGLQLGSKSGLNYLLVDKELSKFVYAVYASRCPQVVNDFVIPRLTRTELLQEDFKADKEYMRAYIDWYKSGLVSISDALGINRKQARKIRDQLSDNLPDIQPYDQMFGSEKIVDYLKLIKQGKVSEAEIVRFMDYLCYDYDFKKAALDSPDNELIPDSLLDHHNKHLKIEHQAFLLICGCLYLELGCPYERKYLNAYQGYSAIYDDSGSYLLCRFTDDDKISWYTPEMKKLCTVMVNPNKFRDIQFTLGKACGGCFRINYPDAKKDETQFRIYDSKGKVLSYSPLADIPNMKAVDGKIYFYGLELLNSLDMSASSQIVTFKYKKLHVLDPAGKPVEIKKSDNYFAAMKNYMPIHKLYFDVSADSKKILLYDKNKTKTEIDISEFKLPHVNIYENKDGFYIEGKSYEDNKCFSEAVYFYNLKTRKITRIRKKPAKLHSGKSFLLSSGKLAIASNNKIEIYNSSKPGVVESTGKYLDTLIAVRELPGDRYVLITSGTYSKYGSCLSVRDRNHKEIFGMHLREPNFENKIGYNPEKDELIFQTKSFVKSWKVAYSSPKLVDNIFIQRGWLPGYFKNTPRHSCVYVLNLSKAIKDSQSSK